MFQLSCKNCGFIESAHNGCKSVRELGDFLSDLSDENDSSIALCRASHRDVFWWERMHEGEAFDLDCLLLTEKDNLKRSQSHKGYSLGLFECPKFQMDEPTIESFIEELIVRNKFFEPSYKTRYGFTDQEFESIKSRYISRLHIITDEKIPLHLSVHTYVFAGGVAIGE